LEIHRNTEHNPVLGWFGACWRSSFFQENLLLLTLNFWVPYQPRTDLNNEARILDNLTSASRRQRKAKNIQLGT
jgi:hypothetical protein